MHGFQSKVFSFPEERADAITLWLNSFSKNGFRTSVVGYVQLREDVVLITVRNWKVSETDQNKMHSDLREVFEEPVVVLDEEEGL